MTARTDAVEADRWVIYLVAIASPVVIWRAAFDPFILPKATLVVLGGAALLSLAVVRLIRSGVVAFPRSLVAYASVAVAIGLVLTTILSDNVATSVAGQYKRFTGLTLYLSCVLLLLAVQRVFGRTDVSRLTTAQLAGCGLVIAYGLAQWLGWEPYQWQNLYGDAVFSFLGNPNFAGAFAGLSVGLGLWGVTNDSWPAWARGGPAALVLGSVVVAITSDSFQGPATVVVAMTVFAFGWLLSRGGRAMRVGAPVLGITAAIATATVVAGFSGAGPLDRLNEQKTLQLRAYYWEAALNMFRARPISGVGIDRYAAFYRSERTQEAALNSVFSVSADEPHNTFLDMFAEGGLLLGLPYLLFVGVTAWSIVIGCRRLRGGELLLLSGLSAAWAAYQVQSLVSIDVPPLAVMHWLLAGSIALVVAPPEWREVRLPWAPAPAPTRRRKQVRRSSSGFDVAAYAVGAVIALASLVILTRPLRADAEYESSRAASASNENEAAFDHADRSTEIAPWETTYWFQAGVRRLTAGQEEEALRLFEDAIDRDPRGLEQVVSAARVSEVTGDVDRAAALYEDALEIEPYAPEMVLEVARFEISHEMFDEAVEHAEYLVDVRPENPLFWEVLGDALGGTGSRRRALESYERALELSTDSTEIVRKIEALA